MNSSAMIFPTMVSVETLFSLMNSSAMIFPTMVSVETAVFISEQFSNDIPYNGETCVFVFQRTWNQLYFPHVFLSFRVLGTSDIFLMYLCVSEHMGSVIFSQCVFVFGISDISPMWTWNQ